MTKLFSLIAAISFQLILVVSLKLLDNFWLIITLLFLCLAVGGVLHFPNKNKKTSTVNSIGWGLFYGSITSLSLIIIFIIWLYLYFPK
jgi:uncharacterized BrkB/YihY/UPF0761 family membrane protein